MKISQYCWDCLMGLAALVVGIYLGCVLLLGIFMGDPNPTEEGMTS